MTDRPDAGLRLVLIAAILAVGVISLAACQPQQFRQPRHEPATRL
ncbi:hypothetical protein ACN2C7_17415 [Caulobacter sp. ErkDOM-E]